MRVGENELLGSFFGFIFLLFPIKVAQGQANSSQAGLFPTQNSPANVR